MKKVYRIHVNIVQENGEVDSYGAQGDDLKKVVKKAKKLADMMQGANPKLQVNFFLFEAEFKDISMPEWAGKELCQ